MNGSDKIDSMTYSHVRIDYTIMTYGIWCNLKMAEVEF